MADCCDGSTNMYTGAFFKFFSCVYACAGACGNPPIHPTHRVLPPNTSQPSCAISPFNTRRNHRVLYPLSISPCQYPPLTDKRSLYSLPCFLVWLNMCIRDVFTNTVLSHTYPPFYVSFFPLFLPQKQTIISTEENQLVQTVLKTKKCRSLVAHVSVPCLLTRR